jgi:CRISPR-associated protein Cas2
MVKKVRRKPMKAKKLFVVVAYDISNTRKRTKVSKILEQYGVRINRSVFECMFTKDQFDRIKKELKAKINSKTDVLVFYVLCINCYSKLKRFPDQKTNTDQIVTV